MQRFHFIIPWLIIFGAVWVSSIPELGGPGFTWDEAYYYPPFTDVAEWTGLLFFNPSVALSSECLWAGWEQIHELPPVVKWLGAAAVSLVPPGGWNSLMAMRLLPAAAFATSIILMMLIGQRVKNTLAGVIAATVYTMIPRVFGHAQIAATESIFVAVTLLVVWTALHDLSRWRWRIAIGVVCGLAVATKVNGIILVCAILFWLVSRRVIDAKVFRAKGRRGLIQSDLLAVVAIIVLAPAVALAVWPWMWDETGARLAEYYLFIREHAYQGVWYLGERLNFTGSLAPPTYPFVMVHVTTPVWLLAAFWTAMAAGLARLVMRRKLQPGPYLLALAMLAPFAAQSLPASPKYDGVRLFLPAFAPAALLAGVGIVWIIEAYRRRFLRTRRPMKCDVRIALAAPMIAVLLQAAVLRPGIDFYNMPTRLAARDEAIFPFEQTYWANAVTPEMIEELNERLPRNARVKTRALFPQIFTILQDWGLLRGDIKIEPEPPYDVHLIQTRRGFWGNADWLIYQNRTPLAGWGEGVGSEPKIYLYDGRPPGT